MTPKKFQDLIWKYYRENKRIFPWRETLDPYKILVSEIMLQQTQTERVKIKYAEWLQHFPTIQDLAAAPLQEVLTHWQGLGYNRRAIALKRAAQEVVEKYDGQIPAEYEKIVNLPGIGPYTAGAVLAFAFNIGVPIIETNIRTAYIHHFFASPKHSESELIAHGNIHDKEILELVKKTLPKDDVKQWYYALMDYGVMLKKTVGNLNKRSKHYTKQSKFEGSNRQIRAALVKAITTTPHTLSDIKNYLQQQKLTLSPEMLAKNLADLQKEGFITEENDFFRIS